MAAHNIINEQLALGRLEKSNSPWNTPIFVIKKKSGKYRLLQDLRAVNQTMVIMGALQPGLPSPAAIPKNYMIIIIDLKDCFFTIPLFPADKLRFAFSLPSLNFIEPMQRYQWRMLPQGMANSPTLCQQFVAQVIAPVRKQFPQIYFIHYMDDLLLAYSDKHILLKAYNSLQSHLSRSGLVIAADKVQMNPPFSYLGKYITNYNITPQKIEIRTDVLKTLNDFQKLLGDINWLRPSLKLTTGQLQPLFNILKGSPDPSSPRILTSEAQQALKLVNKAIQSAQLTRIEPSLPILLIICATSHTPTALLWQETGILEWIHMKNTPNKVITPYYELIATLVQLGRKRNIQLVGYEPNSIIIPYTTYQYSWLLFVSDIWALAFAGYSGIIDNHYPSNKLLHFATQHLFIFPKTICSTPILNAPNVFTDGSANGIAVVISDDLLHKEQTDHTSAQRVELHAISLAFQIFSHCSFNLYTDSHYLVTILHNIETAIIGNTVDSQLFQTFFQLQKIIRQHDFPVAILHIRAHSGLPGPLSLGNQLADENTKIIALSLSQPQDLATQSHNLHHQSAAMLQKQFSISRETARYIVKSCSKCLPHLPVPQFGVNPRGLLPHHLWQMDVTHIPSFGKLQFVHVTVDTYSNFICATPLAGESTKYVITHLFHCFASMGIPKALKTDNAPGYTSKAFANFCATFHISHKTGIPYNPQGQGIVERANQQLKITLQKIKKGEYDRSPQIMLNHALFILNFLTLDAFSHTPYERLFTGLSGTPPEKALVKWKDPMTNLWHGPDPVLVWGRGHVCVFPREADSPRWLPERLVRHYHAITNKHPDSKNASPEALAIDHSTPQPVPPADEKNAATE